MINNQTPNKSVPSSNILRIILPVILIVIIIFLGYHYLSVRNKLAEARNNIESQAFNNKALNFTAFFIESVLQAEGEVDFETRLKLEGMVRDLGDREVLDIWNRFVNAPDDNIAQAEVKNLLSILMNRIKPSR